MAHKSKVRTCLWFEKNGREAADFYVSLLPDSRVEDQWSPDNEAIQVIDFTLAGAPFQILQAGPQFNHSEAASISVLTKDQAETDRLWDVLTANGGEESQCGWLKDKYGVSWQVVPEALIRMNSHDDKEAAQRAREAMYQMKKIDIAALEAAFKGEGE